ncbi:MAG: cell division protein FtsZ [Candidatus Coatesbacteria bacterium]|nr:cell division protein FtsZ [Candidatus Coatesbacteria bacterium]
MLELLEQEHQTFARLKVIGVGGGGGNAVNRMVEAGLQGVEFIVANTDAQALLQNRAHNKIQLGARLTNGLGAGAKPEIGGEAAEESRDELLQAVRGTDMLFITAGLGGGTGTGAAPIIARMAREEGILTVGVVTKPFNFEGPARARKAERGLKEITEQVDTLIVIPNQRLLAVVEKRTSFQNAFAMADDILHQAVQGISDIIMVPGMINVDFADVKTVMSGMGQALMGTGYGTSDNAIHEAVANAVNSPLLDGVSIEGAMGVLVNITAPPDLPLYAVEESMSKIRESVDENAEIVFGVVESSLPDQVTVTVIATGFTQTRTKVRDEEREEKQLIPDGLIDELDRLEREGAESKDEATIPFKDLYEREEDLQRPTFMRLKEYQDKRRQAEM